MAVPQYQHMYRIIVSPRWIVPQIHPIAVAVVHFVLDEPKNYRDSHLGQKHFAELNGEVRSPESPNSTRRVRAVKQSKCDK